MVQQSPSCSLTHTHTPPHSFSPLSRSIDISHLLADIAKRTFPTLVWMSGRLQPWIFCPLISYTRTHTHTHVSLCLSISCPLCFFSLSGLFYLPNLLLFFLFPHQLCTPQSLRSACEIRSAAASRLGARQEHLVFRENLHHLIIIFQTFTHASLSESQSFPCQIFVGFYFDLSPPYRPQ